MLVYHAADRVFVGTSVTVTEPAFLAALGKLMGQEGCTPGEAARILRDERCWSPTLPGVDGQHTVTVALAEADVLLRRWQYP